MVWYGGMVVGGVIVVGMVVGSGMVWRWVMYEK